jgi:membrane-bound inhibitor of C-type lysozyme
MFKIKVFASFNALFALILLLMNWCCIDIGSASAIGLSDNYEFSNSLGVNSYRSSGSTNYYYDDPAPGDKLTIANFTITSPQMEGVLRIVLADASYTLIDKDRTSISSNLLKNLTLNLTENGMTVKTQKKTSEYVLFKIVDASGKYVGSVYEYWTQQNVYNLFALMGYGSQSETEKQVKAMKVVRKTSANSIPGYGTTGYSPSSMLLRTSL